MISKVHSSIVRIGGGRAITDEVQTGVRTTARARWPWRVIGVVLAAYAAATLVEFILWDSHSLPEAGTIGAEQQQLIPDPSAGPGFVRVTEVAANSPLARAGVIAGDRLRFEPVFDYLRYRRTGEIVQAVVDRAGQRSSVSLRAVPRTDPPNWELVRFYIGNLIPTIFGAFIIWRSRRRAVALLLGAALVVFGPPSTSAMMWEGGRNTFLFFATLNRACIVLVSVFLLAFAMRFVHESVGVVGRRQWIGLALYAVLNLIVIGLWSICGFTLSALPLIGDASILLNLGYLGFAASLAYLVIGWRRSAQAERERFALFLVGVAALLFAQLISFVVFLNLNELYNASNPLLTLAEILSGVVAPLLLTHAILRHRVLDLGFILNRTLVYGGVSATLLIAFGLIEWAVEHVVKIEGREQNALIDAAIALSIYLVFHRFRDAAEHFAESVFFREWHEREAAFRRSVANAGFITGRSPLMDATLRAFGSFCAGAGIAIYLKDEAGDYALADNSLEAADASFSRDHPMVVELRAHPKTLRLEGSYLPTLDLALPMAHRNELLGFILVASKTGGAAYRADEVEALAWATNQVGLDLHALTVDRLEAIVRAQDQQIKILKARDDLLSAIAPRVG